MLFDEIAITSYISFEKYINVLALPGFIAGIAPVDASKQRQR